MISLVIAAAALAGSGIDTLLTTPFCLAAANPAKFLGREISVRAEFVSDGIERSALFDQNCKGRHGMGIGAEIQAGSLDAVSMGFDVLNRGKRPRVIASFQGRIVREQPNNFQFYKDDGYRFSVRRVTNVKVGPNVR